MSPDVSRARGYVLTLFLAYCVSTFSISLFCFHSRLCGCPRPLAPKNKVQLLPDSLSSTFDARCWASGPLFHLCRKPLNTGFSDWSSTLGAGHPASSSPSPKSEPGKDHPGHQLPSHP